MPIPNFKSKEKEKLTIVLKKELQEKGENSIREGSKEFLTNLSRKSELKLVLCTEFIMAK